MSRLGKVMFAVSPIIFALIGYAAGHQVGYGAAKVQYENYSLAHDAALKDLGVCQWAEAVASRLGCDSLTSDEGTP